MGNSIGNPTKPTQEVKIQAQEIQQSQHRKLEQQNINDDNSQQDEIQTQIKEYRKPQISEKIQKREQTDSYVKLLSIDEHNMIDSQQNDKINPLKQNNYKQANIMSRYNNCNYTYSNSRSLEQNKQKLKEEINQQQQQNQHGLASPHNQQKFLKHSPQIPPKTIIQSQTYQNEQNNHQQLQLGEEEKVQNSNENQNYGSQSNKRAQTYFNNNKNNYNFSCSSMQHIPCEFCAQKINEELYYEHSQNCLQNYQNENNIVNRSQAKKSQTCVRPNRNDSMREDNFKIECDVCNKQILLSEFKAHQEICDINLICDNCKKPVPSKKFNVHLEECIENPWISKNNQNQQQVMKMCDFCRIFIVCDEEHDFEIHINSHQKQKKMCQNCNKVIRFKYQFQFQQHLDKKCQEPQIKANSKANQRILLMSKEETEKYQQNQQDKGALQEYWDMIDRYIYEEKHGLKQDIIDKIPNFQYSDRKKFLKKHSTYFIEEENAKKKDSKTKQKWQNQPCTICMDDFTSNCNISLLPCLHAYHSECLKEWLQRDGVCAVCRKNIVEMLKANKTIQK